MHLRLKCTSSWEVSVNRSDTAPVACNCVSHAALESLPRLRSRSGGQDVDTARNQRRRAFAQFNLTHPLFFFYCLPLCGDAIGRETHTFHAGEQQVGSAAVPLPPSPFFFTPVRVKTQRPSCAVRVRYLFARSDSDSFVNFKSLGSRPCLVCCHTTCVSRHELRAC